MFKSSFLWIYWDPDRYAFTIPVINHPIAWYGILFALGFFVSYLMVRESFSYKLGSKEIATKLTDTLTWYIILGTIIGARLVEVFFYSWPYYKDHLLDILKIWEGGLASHGGALGVMTAILIFRFRFKKEYPKLTFLSVFDSIIIPTALVGVFIRLGNFINQEILGTVTNLPWGVIFGHPAEPAVALPRHPVQLYESAFYLVVFILLYTIWHFKKDKVINGFYSGLFLVLTFGFRFVIEWFKMPQGDVISKDSLFSMGQILSVPFILFGLYLLFFRTRFFPDKGK